MPEPLISNVSDTARWMAAYRAAESARHDALFNDPFAERFAGERGHAIAAAAPRLTRNGWWWVTRTKLIDDLVAESVQNGCDPTWRPALTPARIVSTYPPERNGSRPIYPRSSTKSSAC